MPHEPEQALPVSCPRCGVGEGQPFKTVVDASGIRVALRCNRCHHEWEIREHEPEQEPAGDAVGSDSDIYRIADAALLKSKILRGDIERGISRAEQLRSSNAEKLTAVGESVVRMLALRDEIATRRPAEPLASLFPTRCVSCHQREGLPFCVTTVADTGGLRASLRCTACNHEWEIDLGDQPDIVGPAKQE